MSSYTVDSQHMRLKRANSLKLTRQNNFKNEHFISACSFSVPWSSIEALTATRPSNATEGRARLVIGNLQGELCVFWLTVFPAYFLIIYVFFCHSFFIIKNTIIVYFT